MHASISNATGTFLTRRHHRPLSDTHFNVFSQINLFLTTTIHIKCLFFFKKNDTFNNNKTDDFFLDNYFINIRGISKPERDQSFPFFPWHLFPCRRYNPCPTILLSSNSTNTIVNRLVTSFFST